MPEVITKGELDLEEPLKNGYRSQEVWSEDEDLSSTSSDSSDSDEFFKTMREGSAPKVIPIAKTKGELDLDDLPPIEQLGISVAENDVEKIGKVYAIVDRLVVIRALKDSRPLDLDSVLFLQHDRPLGRIFDVFGQVVEPFYCVRFNNSSDIKNIQVDAGVFYAPRKSEITSYVFVDGLQNQKGSDASWKDNNEPPEEYIDYSDDQEEQVARRKHKNLNRDVHQSRCSRRSSKRPSLTEHRDIELFLQSEPDRFGSGRGVGFPGPAFSHGGCGHPFMGDSDSLGMGPNIGGFGPGMGPDRGGFVAGPAQDYGGSAAAGPISGAGDRGFGTSTTDRRFAGGAASRSFGNSQTERYGGPHRGFGGGYGDSSPGGPPSRSTYLSHSNRDYGFGPEKPFNPDGKRGFGAAASRGFGGAGDRRFGCAVGGDRAYGGAASDRSYGVGAADCSFGANTTDHGYGAGSAGRGFGTSTARRGFASSRSFGNSQTERYEGAERGDRSFGAIKTVINHQWDKA